MLNIFLILILCKQQTFCIGGRKRKVGSSASNFLTLCGVTQKQVIDTLLYISNVVAMVTAFFCFCRKSAKIFNRYSHLLHFYISYNTLDMITNFVHLKEKSYAVNMKDQTIFLKCL